MNASSVSINKGPALKYPGGNTGSVVRKMGQWGLNSCVSVAKLGVKSFLPQPLVEHLRRRNARAKLRNFYAQWDQIRSRPIVGRSIVAADRLLIFPADPGAVIGSLGDEAMISVAVARYRTVNPSLQVDILCYRGEGERAVRELGFNPVVLPDTAEFVGAIDTLLRTGGYYALVALGADVLDGYYSAEYSRKLIATADIAARAGVQSLILGFSFNEAAAPELSAAFARLDPSVSVNVRDEISLERFLRFAPVRAQLVADAAFALPPGEVDATVVSWIAQQRAEGRRVIGLNLHPMLIRGASARQIGDMVKTTAEAIVSANGKGRVAWLLVPHDYRDASGDGDGICLRPLYEQLKSVEGLNCLYFEGRHRAATLKALAGKLDGVVTGRMHLAIASLGMGVPTLGLSYQGKFEGLYRHFGLPQEFLLAPSAFQSQGVIGCALERFLAYLPELTARVSGERPKVLGLAEKNFAMLDARGA